MPVVRGGLKIHVLSNYSMRFIRELFHFKIRAYSLHLEQFPLDTFLLQYFPAWLPLAPSLHCANISRSSAAAEPSCRFLESLSQVLE